MAWAKVDDGWWAHRKVMHLSLAARGLWTTCLSWSCQYRTDTIPDPLVRMVGGDDDLVDELERAGMWHRTDGGYQIHDWADYQDRSLSEKRAEAGRLGGQASSNGQSHDKQAPSKPEANEQAGVPARPDPDPTPEPKDDDAPDPADAAFDDFWQRYPRGRAGKPGGDGSRKKALQRWRRMTQQQRDQALAAVDNYRAHVESPDGAFAAHATTWLNDERWEQWQQPAANGARASPRAHETRDRHDPDQWN